MSWACLSVQGLVVSCADGLHCLVPRQGAALCGHSSLGTSARSGTVGSQVRKSLFSLVPLCCSLLPK